MISADAGLLLDAIERPGSWLAPDAAVRRNRTTGKSPALAWSDMHELAGTDAARWRWSQLHHSLFLHPLANAANDATRARLNVWPFPKQGGSDTVNLSPFDFACSRQIGGPSFPIVIDVGNWDNSRAMNTPGQSADPASLHYRDLVQPWLKCEHFPLLSSRAAVEAAAVRSIDLVRAR